MVRDSPTPRAAPAMTPYNLGRDGRGKNMETCLSSVFIALSLHGETTSLMPRVLDHQHNCREAVEKGNTEDESVHSCILCHCM